MATRYEFVDKHEKAGLYAAWFLLVVALFLNMGAYPLFLEEPRRALIALEMLLNKNLLVPTEFGEFYYKKPPVWNWMIIVGYKIFGFNETAVRFFGIVSYVLQGVMICWVGRKYVGTRFGHYSSLLFLTVVNGLFYMTGVPGEIDLFYSMLTFGMFVSIFHFLQERQYLRLFVVTYLITAIGVLTKGMPSFAFTALTLMAVSIERKRFQLLFSWQHLAGILVLTTVLVSYFLAYHQHNDILKYFFTDESSLFAQSAEKSFLGSGIGTIVRHFFAFPFGIFFNLMPAMLLLIFFIGRKTVLFEALQNPLIRFFVLVFLVNILIYWLSPGARSRYLYMLYPVPVMLATFAYLQEGAGKWMKKSIRYTVMGLHVALMIALVVVLSFGSVLELDLPNLQVTAVLCLLAIAGLLFLLIKRKGLVIVAMILLLVVLRIGYATTVQLQRAESADMAQAKEDANQIAEIIGEHNIYLYKQVPISRQHIYYVELNTMSVVKYYKKNVSADFLWASPGQIEELSDYEIVHRYVYRKAPACILKKKSK